LPELPEVETVRRDLHTILAGRMVKSTEVTGLRTIRRHSDPGQLDSRLVGRTFTSVGRRGKYLLNRLDSGDVLVAHLGMSGQLRLGQARSEVVPHTHVMIEFADGSDLRFVDPRTFGEMFVSASGPGGEVPELAQLGFDAFTQLPSGPAFARLLAARRSRLKPLLMDQRFVAGIGNIYSDEILFRSRLRHDRLASTLTPPEARRLRSSISRILSDAVDRRGSTLADLQYRDLLGEMGDFQRFHRVYGREGMRCSRCGSAVVRERAAGRSTFFCPQCQT
jgi:formamidopyrimidine-DNA glycosylase